MYGFYANGKTGVFLYDSDGNGLAVFLGDGWRLAWAAWRDEHGVWLGSAPAGVRYNGRIPDFGMYARHMTEQAA